MEKRGTRLPVNSGFSFDSESERETGSREAGSAPRPSSFCRVPRGTFVLRKEMGTLQHFAPVGSSCYQPAVKCDCFCNSVDCCCCLAVQEIRAGALAGAPRGEPISYLRGKCLLALFRQPLIWIDTSCWGGLRDKEAKRGLTAAMWTAQTQPDALYGAEWDTHKDARHFEIFIQNMNI